MYWLMYCCHVQKVFPPVRYVDHKRRRIGTQCVHVASQKKYCDRMFIEQNETSNCNYLDISYNAYNAITGS